MFTADDRHLLKKIARDSIHYGLKHGTPLPIDTDSLSNSITDQGASFVTLYLHGSLRGCIGSLEAHRPLAEDVAHNAFSAAFQDYRFTPVEESEFAALEIHLSILSKAVPIPCHSEQELLAQLNSGVDGLIIEDNGHRATFLPSVWESLPQPATFVEHLKVKAGLPANYWSDTIRCYRYHTESF